MAFRFQTIQQIPLETDSTFITPSAEPPQQVSLNAPALAVMTDLAKVSVVGVRSKASLTRAMDKMKRYGVRMLIVVDDTDIVKGLLTLSDLHGDKPVRALARLGVKHDDLTVSDVMTPVKDLRVMLLEDLEMARVGHVVATLKQAGRHHGLVAEITQNGRHRICGLFSVSQIVRQLGGNVRNFDLEKMFEEIDRLAERETAIA